MDCPKCGNNIKASGRICCKQARGKIEKEIKINKIEKKKIKEEIKRIDNINLIKELSEEEKDKLRNLPENQRGYKYLDICFCPICQLKGVSNCKCLPIHLKCENKHYWRIIHNEELNENQSNIRVLRDLHSNYCIHCGKGWKHKEVPLCECYICPMCREYVYKTIKDNLHCEERKCKLDHIWIYDQNEKKVILQNPPNSYNQKLP